MSIRHSLAIAIACFIAYPGPAQVRELPAGALPGLRIDNWQMEQGLPVNSIISIAQTADGWMFFGTEEGLVRFDGEDFTLMNKFNIPGLSVNYISTLAGTRDSSLWIGTEGDGLFRYKWGTFTKYSKKTGLADDNIFALCEDASGGLWIGTSGGGLSYFKEGSLSRIDTTNGLACNYVRSIVTDRMNRVWVGTQKGLSCITDGKIRNYTEKDGLPDEFIEYLATDGGDDLWIATKSKGLWLLRQGVFSNFSKKAGLQGNSVTCLKFDAENTLWIGSNGNGISRLKDGRIDPLTTREGLTGDLIAAVYPDREGNLWVGSSGTGIDRIKKKTITTITEKEGLSGNVILPVFEDHDGTLWVGIAGKGLNAIRNGRVQSYAGASGLPDELVLTLCEDRDNALWIGTAGGGLTRYQDNVFKTFTQKDGLSNDVITALYCTRSGALWAGTTGAGINRYENGTFRVYNINNGLSDDNVNCILEDHEGSLWIGTNDGLSKLTGDSIRIVRTADGLSENYILSLYEDADNNIWVGTASNGFNLIRNGHITSFTTQNGLINDVVLRILEDDSGFFWISCNKGIYKIGRQDLLDFADGKITFLAPVAYGKTDGMESAECNGGVSPAGCKSKTGLLYFPTMCGISVIDPTVMNAATSYYSGIYIEDLLANGQPVATASPIILPRNTRRIEFRFASLDYASPERIRYRYKLIGFDKEWVEVGSRRTAYFTNLNGGSYTFSVMASNGNGQWEGARVSELSFRLKPPFMRSVPYFLIIILSSLLVFSFILYFFMERIQKGRLKKLVAIRTQELNEEIAIQNKTHEQLIQANAELLVAKERAESGDRLKSAFMNNISHEIRTPLNGILGFNELIADPETAQKDRDNYVAMVHSSSDRLLNTIGDYMDISLLVSKNLKANCLLTDPLLIVQNLFHKYSPSCKARKLNFELSVPDARIGMEIWTDPELLIKALGHLVDNAVKFTQEGSVSLGFEISGKEIIFTVTDTGCGIREAEQASMYDVFIQSTRSSTRNHPGSGLGLPIARGITDLLNGQIRFETKPGFGSKFQIILPLNQG